MNSFATFVVGDCNRAAYEAARALAANPGEAYNPFFLYGAAGIGKTHLLQAITNEVSSTRLELRIAYLSAEDFSNEMVQAIRDDQTDAFRATFRRLDVLLVDNLQFLNSRPRMEQEFFRTMEFLRQAGKQIVFAGGRPPGDASGSMVRTMDLSEIKPPDFKTRLAILRNKCQLEGWLVPNEVLAYIAVRHKANAVVLLAALLRLVTYHGIDQGELTIDRTETILRDAVFRRALFSP